MSSGLKRANSNSDSESPSKKIKSTVTYVVSIIEHNLNDGIYVRSEAFSKRIDAFNYMRADANSRPYEIGFYKIDGDNIFVGEALTFDERNEGDWSVYTVSRCELDKCILKDLEDEVDH